MSKGGKVALWSLIVFVVSFVVLGTTGAENGSFAAIAGISMVTFFIGAIMWIVGKLKRIFSNNPDGKEKRVKEKNPKKLTYAIGILLIVAVAFCMRPSKKAPVEPDAPNRTIPASSVKSEIAQTIDPTITPSATVTPEPTPTSTPMPTQTLAPGESRETAYVLTVDEFVKEIKQNKNAAAEKYNGKYVELTGTITDISSIGKTMTGYYLYGKRLNKGLNITCWVSGSISLDLSTGKKGTFQGIVREITTVNNTELGECIIIK